LAFEHYKTQVLLLHSEQGKLDSLSAGFNDKYSVHCATSGTEALNIFGDTPIHVIVSAQDLPGMSGLDALREAKKRSPETIGILLADPGKSDELEALVGDKEVFQVVRGSVSPESLLKLVESATQQVRLMALAESANDTAANPDEPVSEDIVMETSENGSLIISDGTGRMPALQPHKINIAADAGAREVDILVMTRDEDFLATIRDSARGLHNLHHAVTPTQAENFVSDKTVGVLVTDAAMVGSDIESLTDKLRKERPRLVAIVAGRRDDGEMLMDLINRGHVYRFLLKPVSPGRARLAIEASVKHHLEAPDSAFKPKAQSATTPLKPVAKAKPVAKKAPKPAPKPKPAAKKAPKPAARKAAKPQAKPAPQPAAKPKPIDEPIPVLKPVALKPPKKKAKQKPPAKPAPKPVKKAAPKPVAKKTPKPAAKPIAKAAPKPVAKKAPKPAAKPAPKPRARDKVKPAPRIEPTISAAPVDDGPAEAFAGERKITAAMSGIADSVDKTLASAGALAGGAQDAVQATSKAVADAIGGAATPFPKTKTMGIAASVIVVVALGSWFTMNRDTNPVEVAPEPVAAMPTVVESEIDFALPAPAVEADPVPEVPTYQPLLDEARAARDAGNLIVPESDNAVELYLMVLEDAPDVPQIRAELDNVIDQVLGLAEAAILEQSIVDADSALAMVRLADPDNPRLTFLDAQLTQLQFRTTVDEARLAIRDGFFEDAGRLISEARYLVGDVSAEVNLLSQELSAARDQAHVEELLATAGERLEAGDLLSPSDNNARYYYELALSSDPGNQAAQQGLAIVASKLVLRAREAIDEGRLDDAGDLLRDARGLDPSSEELAASSKALDTAFAAIAEAERQAQAARQAELERQAELARQAEAERRAEQVRQAELARQAEAERQAELRKQAELERQAEIERLAELERQAEEARLAEIARQAEEARLARIKEEQQRLAEQEAAAAATASVLGVAGSTVKESSANSAPSRPAPVRNRTVEGSNAPEYSQTMQARNIEAPAAGISRPAAAPADMPTITLPLTADATDGATTFAMGENADARQASVPAGLSAGNNVIESINNRTGNSVPVDNRVPISALTRTNYVAPDYPRAAQRRNLTGTVDLMFTVSTIGTVTDITVLNAEPEGTFNQAAMKAVSKWRFEPVIENGVALEKRTAVRLNFDLQ
jgi:TonB family protein